MINCIECGEKISKESKYCSFCAAPQICTSCSERLAPQAKFCSNCGKAIIGVTDNETQQEAPINTIEFKESQSERSFKATFSDTVGENISKAITDIVESRLAFPIPQTPEKSEFQEIEAPQEEMPEYEEIPTEINTPKSSKSEAPIATFFGSDGDGTITLRQPHLKANSKLDYSRRLSILFVYYKQFILKEEVSRKEINQMLERVSVHSNSTRTWLGKSPSFSQKGKSYRLSLPGEKEAEKIISQVIDDDYPEKWSLSQLLKKSGNTSSKSSSKGSSYSPRIVSNLDFFPKGKTSFEGFLQSYKYRGNPQKILMSVYYMERILEIDRITIDHIFTCLKKFKAEIPISLPVIIQQTISRNGFIEKDSQRGYKVSIKGENQLEHKMKK